MVIYCIRTLIQIKWKSKWNLVNAVNVASRPSIPVRKVTNFFLIDYYSKSLFTSLIGWFRRLETKEHCLFTENQNSRLVYTSIFLSFAQFFKESSFKLTPITEATLTII